MTFTFVDLFAGIGGFHLAIAGLGGTCTLAAEIDPAARAVYAANLGLDDSLALVGDIHELTSGRVRSRVPEHDLLAAGFPCQPFSKSGKQGGIEEVRGTLFYEIAKIVESRRPRVVVLENVRNLAGPRHHHTWTMIVRVMRDLGYRLPDAPIVFSPHLLPREAGGTPQVRERVFAVAVYVGERRAWANTDDRPPIPNRSLPGWHPSSWDIEAAILESDLSIRNLHALRLSDAETGAVEAWDTLVQRLRTAGTQPPGHPIWGDDLRARPRSISTLPDWKADFILKNGAIYTENRSVIEPWLKENNYLRSMIASHRKFEWQAQDLGSAWDGLIQFRPSGIRVKKPNYVPALVAMTQTSVFGPRRRRLSVREAARLQGFPDLFEFGAQRDSISYRQLGNAVAVGAVSHVLKECALAWGFFPHDLRDAFLAGRANTGLPVDAVNWNGTVDEGR